MSSDRVDLQKYRVNLDKRLKDIIGRQYSNDCLQGWLIEQGMGNLSSEQAYTVTRKVLGAIREGLVMEGLSNPLNRAFLDGLHDCDKYIKGPSILDSVAYAASPEPRLFENKVPEVDKALRENAADVVAALSRLAPKDSYIRQASETCSQKGATAPECTEAIREMARRVNILELKGLAGEDKDAQILLARLARS